MSGLSKPSAADALQIRTVSLLRFEARLGRLPVEVLLAVSPCAFALRNDERMAHRLRHRELDMGGRVSNVNKGFETGLSQHLYLIQNDVCHYNTGRLNNGNQVLIDECSRVEFDNEGNMLAASSRENLRSTLTALDAERNVLAVSTQEAPEAPSMMLPFTPGTISIKQFFLPDLWLGIQDLPEHYQDFLDYPENANDDECHYYSDEIADWRECGNFVLWWNEDYFLNEDGEIESS